MLAGSGDSIRLALGRSLPVLRAMSAATRRLGPRREPRRDAAPAAASARAVSTPMPDAAPVTDRAPADHVHAIEYRRRFSSRTGVRIDAST